MYTATHPTQRGLLQCCDPVSGRTHLFDLGGEGRLTDLDHVWAAYFGGFPGWLVEPDLAAEEGNSEDLRERLLGLGRESLLNLAREFGAEQTVRSKGPAVQSILCYLGEQPGERERFNRALAESLGEGAA